MTWWEYVVNVAGTESPKALSAASGIDGPNFSKWKAGHVPKVDMVAAFARTFSRPVVEAFVAAGFLTAEEARVRPSAAPSLASLGDKDLLAELASRVLGSRPDIIWHDEVETRLAPAARRTRSGKPAAGQQKRAELDALGEERSETWLSGLWTSSSFRSACSRSRTTVSAR